MSRRTPLTTTLIFGAGLSAGLLRFYALAPALAAVALLARRKRPRLLPPLAVALLGIAFGALAWALETSACAAVLSPGRRLAVVDPRDAAEPGGGSIRAALPEIDCHGTVSARWGPGVVPISARIEARVRWAPRRGPLGRAAGTMVIEEVRKVIEPGSLALRVRDRLHRTIRRLYGRQAGIVDALILNRKDGLEPALRDSFVRAGLVHLLAISGFHVGVLLLWVVLATRLVGWGRTASVVAAGVTITIYVAILGWPPAATRAALMVSLYGWGQIRQRYVPARGLLATTCLVMLLADPWTVARIGAWLSVAALGGILYFGRWANRALGKGRLISAAAATVGATVATAPISAGVFGVVSLVGVVLNLVAMPVAALALPAVLASVAAATLIPPLGAGLATSAGLLLELLQRLAIIGARVPGGYIVQEPGIRAAAPWLAGLLGLGWVVGRNTPREALRRSLWLATALAWGLLVWPRAMAAPDGSLELHFLDVHQGDGAVVRTPGGHWVVIDGGPRNVRWDAGRRVMVPFLNRVGVRRIDVLVASHADADHLGGIPAIMGSVPTALVLEPGDVAESDLYLEFLDEMAAAGIPWRPTRAGDEFTLDGVSFRVLHPDTSWARWGESLNEDSVVLLVRYGDFQALFTGDIGLTAEAYLASRVGRVDLLKVGHHGSKGSTGTAWLEALDPAVAIVSVGPNRYGHPSAEALGRLRRAGVDVWRTDVSGSLTVRTDGRQVVISGRDRSRTLTAVP